MKFLKKHGRKIFWVILALILFLIISPQGRAFYKTLIILPEFIPNSPVKTLNLLTQKPQVKEVEFQSGGRTIDADLWLPQSKSNHPAVVLNLGVDIDRKDPRTQELADIFARSGITTLVPNIPSLGRRRVLKEAKDDLIASFEYLNSLPNIKSNKIGFVGFCASGGLVLLAAEDDTVSDQVAFIVSVNPYYDLASLYKNITLRQIEDDGQIQDWNPNFKTVEIYNRETINLLESDADREILNNHLALIGQDKLGKGGFLELSGQNLNKLSPEAKFTYDGLTNTDPQKTDFYLENATNSQKNFLQELSPAAKISSLKAKTFILMDKNNIYIPYTEAQLLSEALAGRDHLFVETHILPAGDLADKLPAKDYLGESLKIFRFVYSVLLEIS